MSRRSSNYNEGKSKTWDVGEDDFDSMDIENVGLLEITDISLDESELEVVLLEVVLFGSRFSFSITYSSL